MAINQYQEDFSITETGDVSGREYVGIFTVKTRLSHMDRFRQDQIKRSLLGGTNPNDAGNIAMNMAEAFSQLSIRIINAPDWFSSSNGGVDLPDYNVITSIYTAAMAAESKAIAAVQEAANKAKESLNKPITPQI